MEKDRREPVYTEQGYVYDYDDEPAPADLTGGSPEGGAASGEDSLYEEVKGDGKEEKTVEAAGRKKRVLLPVLAAAFLLLGFLAGAWLWNRNGRKETIDLNRYVSLSASGYDGYGKAEVNLDREALESDISACLLAEGAIDAGEGKSRLESFRSYEHYEEIMEAVSWSLDREEDLSNGDTITLTMSYEPADPAGYGVALQGEPLLYTVKGLSDITQVDPFENLTVTADGIGPEGMLHMEWDDSFPWTCRASSDRGLSNGDEVLIRAILDDGMDERALAGGWGYALTRTEMTYRVDGLPSYAADISDLSDEISGALQDLASEKARQKVAESYAPDENMTDLVPAGMLLVSRKEAEEGFFNKIFFLFRVSYSNRETSLEYYYYVSCQDLVLYPDGTWSLDEESFGYPLSLHGLFGLIDSGDYVRIDRMHAVTGFASSGDFYAEYIEPLEGTWNVSGELD